MAAAPAAMADGSAGCAHWDASAVIMHFTRRTQLCARETAIDAGWLYLDVQRLTDRLPPGIIGSPCGNQHPFGVLADATAAALASVAASATATGEIFEAAIIYNVRRLPIETVTSS